MNKYPKATWKGDGVSGGAYTSGPYRVVLHTTETAGMPDYSSGGTAPHLTFNPKTLEWTQHTLLDVAARALRNAPGGVETNRERAIQVEMVCYSDVNVADANPKDRLWVGHLGEQALTELAEFLVWCHDTFDVEMVWPGRRAVSYAGANSVGFRMTNQQWDTFAGVCGHQHAPENYHWDPGAFDWTRLFELIGESMAVIPDAEAQTLHDIHVALQSRGSSGGFAGYAVDLIRQFRGHTVDSLEESADIVDVEARLRQLIAQTIPTEFLNVEAVITEIVRRLTSQ